MTESVETRFIDSAQRHGELRSGADANRAFAKILSAYFELKATPDDGLAAFTALAHHDNASVALWAASFLLHLDEATARSTLVRIAQTNSGLIGGDAEMTLKEWDAGRLKPPEDWPSPDLRVSR